MMTNSNHQDQDQILEIMLTNVLNMTIILTSYQQLTEILTSLFLFHVF